jgi:FAD/FMN-containing dehydrogenase
MPERFTNWASTRTWQTMDCARPSSLAELRTAVRDGIQQNRAMRPMGMRYSFSECIKGLDLTFVFDRLARVRVVSDADRASLPNVLTDAAYDAAAGYGYVEPGARIRTLCQLAKLKGLAPFTLGGSSGQTVIGAVCTSTHGAAIHEHPLPEYVDALHVVSGGGEFWIERPSPNGPLTDAAALAQFLGVPIARLTILRDRAPLDAALVALGAGGVVAGALVRLRSGDALLNERLYKRISWENVVRPALVDRSCFQRVPGEDLHAAPLGNFRELEIMLDPYADPVEVYLSARNEAPANAASPIAVQRPSISVLDFALAIGGNIASYSSALGVLISASRLSGKKPDNTWAYHRYIDVLDAGIPEPQPVHSYELAWEVEAAGVPTYLQFIDHCIAEVQAARAAGRPYLGLVTLRFSRGTSAYLGMQHTEDPRARLFAHVELSPLQDVFNNRTKMPRQNEDFVREVFSHPSAATARLHWGQDSFAPLAFDANRYPKIGQWRTHIGKLVGDHGATFQSAFTQACHATP